MENTERIRENLIDLAPFLTSEEAEQLNRALRLMEQGMSLDDAVLAVEADEQTNIHHVRGCHNGRYESFVL